MQSNTFTLSGATLHPVREALYSALGPWLDEMDSALVSQGREESCATHMAYRRLTAVGALLDKMGWTEHDEKTSLTIETPDEARLLAEALAVELEEEGERAAQARQLGEIRLAREYEANSEIMRETSRSVEAKARAAGLLGGDAGDA